MVLIWLALFSTVFTMTSFFSVTSILTYSILTDLASILTTWIRPTHSNSVSIGLYILRSINFVCNCHLNWNWGDCFLFSILSIHRPSCGWRNTGHLLATGCHPPFSDFWRHNAHFQGFFFTKSLYSKTSSPIRTYLCSLQASLLGNPCLSLTP